MARTGGFWQWYANVNDDVRHRVVEEGWYGRQTTGDIDQSAFAGANAPVYDDPQAVSYSGTVWGNDGAENSLYGTGQTTTGFYGQPDAEPDNQYEPGD